MKTIKKQNAMVITPYGGLTITLEPKDVTWFRFLQASRSTNSLNGGWNSKSHWRNALHSLGSEAAKKFIEDWTRNSLATKDPDPRKEEFMFHRDPSIERGLLNHGPLRKGADLSKMSENELNTRLFHDKVHDLWGKNIGYETPLSAESEGQLKVDIFAIGKGKSSLEIIELKQANNKRDSPLMAMTEAICYGIQAVRCRDYLLENSVLKEESVSTEHFEAIRLILTAPRAYWKYWKWDQGLVEPMVNIIASVNTILSDKKAALLFDKQSICRLEHVLPIMEVV